jgi:hypothetical protein
VQAQKKEKDKDKDKDKDKEETEKEKEKETDAGAPEPTTPEPPLPDACTAVMERAEERPALARASSRKRAKANPRKAGPPTHTAPAAQAGEGEVLGQR